MGKETLSARQCAQAGVGGSGVGSEALLPGPRAPLPRGPPRLCQLGPRSHPSARPGFVGSEPPHTHSLPAQAGPRLPIEQARPEPRDRKDTFSSGPARSPRIRTGPDRTGPEPELSAGLALQGAPRPQARPGKAARE